MGFFPVDAETLKYLRLSGRSEHHVALVEAYTKAQGLFRTDDTPDPIFTDTLELDLGTVEPSLAGPQRPQDRVPLTLAKSMYQDSLRTDLEKSGTLAGVAKHDAATAVSASPELAKALMVADEEGAVQAQHEHGGVPASTTGRSSTFGTAPSSSRRSRAARTRRTRA